MTTSQRRFKGHRDSGARERLVQAARSCLRARGAAAASSRLIAETADENLGAITYYFGSKDELIALALADELSEWIAPALEALSAPGDPAHRLFTAVGALTAAFEDQRERVPALLDVFVRAARDLESRGPIATIWREVHEQLSSVIAELHSRDLIAGWIDPDAMAALIVAVTAGTVVGEAIEPGRSQYRQIAAHFAGLLLGARSNGGSIESVR